MTALSLSFYDDSTLRKKKQVILDTSPLEPSRPRFKRPPSHPSKPKQSSRKLKPELGCEFPLGKERDEIDFSTT
jgi:hypothetical protein